MYCSFVVYNEKVFVKSINQSEDPREVLKSRQKVVRQNVST